MRKKKKTDDAEDDDEEMDTTEPPKKLEKDLMEELGDDYILDLKKNYDIPDEYKYDAIPEFWNGHNIMDFISPDILEV